ncbi:hypothetical protein ZHAS_00009663 [Anopheles sinensis]|uniref:Uncharacterized protein n=1 Tax=Anopheles sinensis TaxID=74873 RepID=A0A084VV30_ANOSI|nr:hypothetical protein ZHAS_00009663 [Anopheles sinensis]
MVTTQKPTHTNQRRSGSASEEVRQRMLRIRFDFTTQVAAVSTKILMPNSCRLLLGVSVIYFLPDTFRRQRTKRRTAGKNPLSISRRDRGYEAEALIFYVRRG